MTHVTTTRLVNPRPLSQAPVAATVRVWDPVVRLFHWGVLSGFTLAWISGDDWLRLHLIAGYTMLGLLALRLAWGIIGAGHARFANFLRPPRTVFTYLRDIALSRAARHLGHNPAGGAMALALMLLLLLTGLSGLALYGAEEAAGPLAVWLQHTPRWLHKALENGHEGLASLTLFMACVHVLGVLLASLQHHENLARAMWTGRKRPPAPGDVP
jgi:cytochrome b